MDTKELLLRRKRDEFRNRLATAQTFAEANRLGQALAYLDRDIQAIDNKKKFSRASKIGSFIKNFGLFKIKKDEKKTTPLKFAAKWAWNCSMQVAKACAFAVAYPPVTLPILGAYALKPALQSQFNTVKNLHTYYPKSKGSWLKAFALANMPTTTPITSLSSNNFRPDSFSTIKNRVHAKKANSQISEIKPTEVQTQQNHPQEINRSNSVFTPQLISKYINEKYKQ